MDGSPVVEEQVGDNEAWDLLLFAIVDELTPHNLRRKKSICLFLQKLYSSNLEHVSGFYFPLPPQLCLLQAANAVIWATLKVPVGEIFSNYDCMTKLSILVCVVLRRILEWLELMGLNLDGHH